MPLVQRNNSIISSTSTLSKQTNVTHCLVQYPNADKTRMIVHVDKVVNPSNRRLKAGDDCTLKGEGRNHARVKILFCGEFETCQHQLDVIGESESINYDYSGSRNASAINDTTDEHDLSNSQEFVLNEDVANKKKNLTTPRSSVQAKILKGSNVSSCSGTPVASIRKMNNKENLQPREKQTGVSSKANDQEHSKKQINTAFSQSHTVKQVSISKNNSITTTLNRSSTQPSSKKDHSNVVSSRNRVDELADLQSLNLNKDQSVTMMDENIQDFCADTNTSTDHDMQSNLSSETHDDHNYKDNEDDYDEEEEDILKDYELDPAATTIRTVDGKQLEVNDAYDELRAKHRRLQNRYCRQRDKIEALQNQIVTLKATMLPLPAPEVQQWFIHTAQRFENKPLSGAVLTDFSKALKLSANVLISLKQSTGSLTARAIIRHLYPSKNRTVHDMTQATRQSILDFVKYCHPNELFMKGKINEAINGPFRTAKYKAAHSTNVSLP